MKEFMDDDFLLETQTARDLYHNHAARMPIIDYHCHLIPRMVAENHQFADLTEIWLGGDHYKWRAMRANGVDEEFITGSKPPYEKFVKWAETVPYTMRNPLYHWTHLELRRVFGINKILNPTTAREIYEECTSKLRTEEFRAQSIMKKMRVEVVCTTDDPVDSLEFHKAVQQSEFEVKMYPAWRPDKAMAVEDASAYNKYIGLLEKAADMDIATFDDLIAALEIRHAFFGSMGGRLSDHGLETFYAADYTQNDLRTIFQKVRSRAEISEEDLLKFRSGMLYEFAVMDCKAGWTQQFHCGTIRNNNPMAFKKLGPDTGYDSIHDLPIAASMNKFFGRLASEGLLAKTILYNLNPADNEVMATCACNFNDGQTPGKMQYGSAWWFLDQKFGMERQMDALSSLGLLSRFVGMVTDSRSFLSYPRHEYFRRILCNLLGNDLENGEIPSSEMEFVGQMVENICYGNAKSYFGFA